MSRAVDVAIHGAGKVGQALFAAGRRAGLRMSLRAARRGLPGVPWDAPLVVLTVRDRDLAPTAARIAELGLVSRDTVVVHVAGAQPASVLDALRPVCAGVAQMHPMIAFATTGFTPTLAGGHVHVAGDPEAVRRARRFAARLGMRPRTFPGLDTTCYHAAAGLVANGATALAAAGTVLLSRAGVPEAKVPLLLGPLLRSVAENVEALGLPGALTGPVRRGDAAAVRSHLATLERLAPELVPLYLAMAGAQLPLARALGDAPEQAFDEVARVLSQDTNPKDRA